MRRLERRRECRALCGALLFLHLTLVCVGANARSLLASVEQARPVTVSATASMSDAQSMASLVDSAPCASCYLAPALSTQGFSGEAKEPGTPKWHVHSVPLPRDDCRLDTEEQQAGLPVRIAFCRWLD